jgi:hypothetical protein
MLQCYRAEKLASAGSEIGDLGGAELHRDHLYGVVVSEVANAARGELWSWRAEGNGPA